MFLVFPFLPAHLPFLRVSIVSSLDASEIEEVGMFIELQRLIYCIYNNKSTTHEGEKSEKR